MNTVGMNMFPVTSSTAATVKPEINSTDIELSVPLAMQQEKFPKWITDFNMKCLDICGTTCSEKLDEMMELYIKEVKREMVYYGPGNASVVVNRMSRTMLFFYLKYVDIKEFIVISQWNEHMEDLLSLYCQLELRSAQRGKDSDIIVCSRIMYALWTYLNSDEEHMLHVLLKIPNISKRHKKILDPIFRKLLVDKKKPEYDLEYIRKLFAYKLWKRLYNVDEKKAISELAYNELQPPKSFIANYSKYHFLPRNLGTNDVHRALITAMFDIETAIHAYFEYVDNKNKRIFDNDCILPEKKSFMTEFWNSFSTNDNFDEISTTSDTFTLERLKQEVDNIDTDDDCIIIEPVKSPSSSGIQTQPLVIDSNGVIDLTADENESSSSSAAAAAPGTGSLELYTDEVPQWCTNLIKISEECVPATPPHSITEEDTTTHHQTIQEEIVKRDIIIEEETTITQIEKQKEIEPIKPIEQQPPTATAVAKTLLDVKISNVRRARLDSNDSTDLSLPDTLSSSTSSEDNSHGFREITSTSHPVQEVPPPPKSVCPSPAEHHPVSVNYEQVDSTSNLNENEEIETEAEPDPEPEPEPEPEPVIQTFILERSVSGLVCSDTLTQVAVSAPTPTPTPTPIVSNVDFEQFATEQTQQQKNTNTSDEQQQQPISIISESSSSFMATETATSAETLGSVSDLNIVSVKHVSDESATVDKNNQAFNISYVTSVIERDEPTETTEAEAEADVDVDIDVEGDVDDTELDVCSEDNVQSKLSEDDIQSPDFEPITQNDCMNYVKGLDTSQYYENFYKESISKTTPTTHMPMPSVSISVDNNRKRKNSDIVRATIKRHTPSNLEEVIPESVEDQTPKVQPIEQQQQQQKERRVPLSGEKVCRFAGPEISDITDIFETVFTDKFKLSKLEYELFNPSVVVKKLNPQHFIPNYNEYTSSHEDSSTPYYSQTIDHSHRSNLHMSRFKTKGILEYQQYTKGSSSGDKPRARIIQINRSVNESSNSSAMHKEQLSSTITTLKKKKGTGSPDLNINFTLPKLESLSLNSSFQHHFCTDISVCTSATKCFSSDSSLSLSTAAGPTSASATSDHPTSLSHQPDPHSSASSSCCFDADVLHHQTLRNFNMENESHMQVQIGFKRPICEGSLNLVQYKEEQQFEFKRPKIETLIVPSVSMSTSTSQSQNQAQTIEPKQEVIPGPILPAEVPFWHEIDSSEPLQKFDHSQACPNLLVNINLDQSEQEIHLPIKKRRVSSFKVEIKDELSYPATPMISIAELENIERNKARNHRPFKTPAELKEVPPIHPSYMYNINTIPPMTTVTDIYNISHTYSTTPPTINYHVTNNEPPTIIGSPITAHYQLPSMQPIIIPVSRAPKTNWEQPTSSSCYSTSSNSSGYRKRRQTASRKETTATHRTVQKEKSKSHKTKIS